MMKNLLLTALCTLTLATTAFAKDAKKSQVKRTPSSAVFTCGVEGGAYVHGVISDSNTIYQVRYSMPGEELKNLPNAKVLGITFVPKTKNKIASFILVNEGEILMALSGKTLVDKTGVYSKGYCEADM
jgi:hypothetical protein